MDKRAFFSQLSLLQQLPPTALDSLATQAHPLHPTKGTTLFTKDNKIHTTYFVVNGRVKLTRTTATGNEAILEIVTGPDCIFTSLPLHDHYTTTAEALDDHTTLLTLPSTLLDQALQANPRAYQSLTLAMADRLARQEGEIERLMLQSTAQRVGCYVLQLYRAQQSNTLVLDIEKASLASRLGMQPETLSRAINHLKKEVGLKVEGNHITLPDPQALAGYVCQQCSNLYPCQSKAF